MHQSAVEEGGKMTKHLKTFYPAGLLLVLSACMSDRTATPLAARHELANELIREALSVRGRCLGSGRHDWRYQVGVKKGEISVAAIPADTDVFYFFIGDSTTSVGRAIVNAKAPWVSWFESQESNDSDAKSSDELRLLIALATQAERACEK